MLRGAESGGMIVSSVRQRRASRPRAQTKDHDAILD